MVIVIVVIVKNYSVGNFSFNWFKNYFVMNFTNFTNFTNFDTNFGHLGFDCYTNFQKFKGNFRNFS